MEGTRKQLAETSKTDLPLQKVATRPIRIVRQNVLGSIDRLKWFLQNGYYSRHSDEPLGSSFLYCERKTPTKLALDNFS